LAGGIGRWRGQAVTLLGQPFGVPNGASYTIR
jgi:hypothetical protein